MDTNYLDAIPGEPLTNAAVEFMRDAYARLRDADGPPAPDEYRDGLSADFRYTGRNRRTVSFGEMTSSDWPEFIATFWDVGAGQPQFSDPQTIAVRGQSCAAITGRIGYGDDTSTDFLHCVRLDPTLQRLQRIVSFDLEDQDEAIPELDSLHAEIDDATDSFS